MYSKYKKISILVIIILIVYICVASALIRKKSSPRLDLTAVNDITQTLAKNWESIGREMLPGLNYGYDYVVIDNEGNLIAATKSGLNESIGSAISNRDTVIDILKDHNILGKLILYNDIDLKLNRNRSELLILGFVTLVAVSTFVMIFLMYANRTIFLPFRKLKKFARHVAAGNLDVPLEMDKDNIFGAFSESFDLMREELKKARESEREANQSKKELVASLSHDIKTPVASIMAVSEIMYAKCSNTYDKEQLQIIYSKSEQIDTLITNMFTATLEELQELEVTVTEQPSIIIYNLIKRADYDNRVTSQSNGECIVLMDVLRLSQIIDNIISNSYKYAGTSISVSIDINDEFLEVSFMDYGKGVADKEIPLLFNKFYRAKNAEGKSGAGLGLYLSRYLITKMSGDIKCENTEIGFVVRLRLKVV